jgi:hypothetical protein
VPLALCHRRKGIRQQLETSHGIWYQRPPCLAFGSERRIGLDLSHHSSRLQCSVRRLLARSEPKRIGISRVLLMPRIGLRYLCHRGQHRVSPNCHRMEQRVLARTADSIRTEGISQKKSMIVGQGAGRGNIGLHIGEPCIPIKTVYREVKQALTRHMLALGGVMDISEHPTTPMYHRCEACTQAVYQQDAKSERGVDLFFRLCLEILEKDRKLRNRDLNAAINLLRLLVIELDGHERAVPLKPRA